MKTKEERAELLQKMAFELDAELPLRVWVEGDGKMYGQFQSNTGQRVLLTEFDAIKLIHAARTAAGRMISV